MKNYNKKIYKKYYKKILKKLKFNKSINFILSFNTKKLDNFYFVSNYLTKPHKLLKNYC